MKSASEFRVHKRGHRIGKCRACELQAQRDYYAADPERYRARKRASMAKARAADPEKVRAYHRALHASNREQKTAAMRAYYARRFFWARAMKLRSATRATHIDLARLWKRQRGLCGLTGERLDRTAQLDHIFPQARGGDDSITNLRWVTATANRAKRDLTDAEFLVLCSRVVDQFSI